MHDGDNSSYLGGCAKSSLTNGSGEFSTWLGVGVAEQTCGCEIADGISNNRGDLEVCFCGGRWLG